VLATPRRG
jgi:secreted PhoX family phosphatase